MILGLEIAMFIGGIIALVSGKMTLAKEKVVTGVLARLLGLVLLAPVPLAFTVGVVIGFAQGVRGGQPSDLQVPLTILELVIVLLCLGIALGGGLFFAEAPRKKRKRRGPMREDRESCDDEPIEVLPVAEREEKGIRTSPRRASPARLGGGEEEPPARRKNQPRSVAGRDRASPALLVCCVLGGVMLLVVVGVCAVFLLRGPSDTPAAQPGPVAVAPPAFVAPPAGPGAEQDRAREALEQQRLAEERRRQNERRQEEIRAEGVRREEQQRQDMVRREEERRQDAVRREAEQARREEEEALRKEKAEQEKLARFTKPLAELTIPASVAGSEKLAVVKNKGDGLTWASLPLGLTGGDRRDDPRRAHVPPVSGACWASDGGSFYALTRAGVLRRVSYPDLKELRKVELGQECQALAVCKLGLMVTLTQLQEIWVVNPETLAVVKRFGVPQLLQALTGPSLGVAYVFCREPNRFSDPQAGMPARLDLADGKLALMTTARDPGVRYVFMRSDTLYKVLSPDGKWLFIDGGALLRFRVEGTTLTRDAATREGMGGGNKLGICISPDSQWVCFPTGGGNDGLNYATYVYRTTDLSHPAFTLHQGAYPEIVGYDPAGKRLFSQNYQHPLIVFDLHGTKRGEHKFGRMRGSHNVKQYAAHPKDGRGLLLRTSDELLLIEFTG